MPFTHLYSGRSKKLEEGTVQVGRHDRRSMEGHITREGVSTNRSSQYKLDFVSLMQGRRQPRISIGLKTRRGAIAGMENNVLIHIVFS
jgi:hypothetical protein